MTAPHLVTVKAALATKTANDKLDVQACAASEYTSIIARKIIVSGLRADTLRNASFEYDRDHEDTDAFLECLIATATRYEREHPAPRNNNNAKHYKAHEIELEPIVEAAADHTSEAEAVKSKNGYKNNKNGAKKAYPPGNEKKFCGYCKTRYHTESECRKKAKAMLERQGAAASFPMPSPAISSPIGMGSASGNSMAGW
jgi:hypothetical protein